MKRRILAWILLVAMLVGLLCTPAVAADTQDDFSYDETDATSVSVIVNLSNDGAPVIGNDDDATVLAGLEVTVPYFDLNLYGLSDFYRYPVKADSQTGEYDTEQKVIKRPTALHLYIYLLERYYLGYAEDACCKGTSKSTGSNVIDGNGRYINDLAGKGYDSDDYAALNISGSHQSLYMVNFWGHDENLMYFRNHAYPVWYESEYSVIGATCDYALLSDGDVMDIAMFSNWNFWMDGAFCYFDKESYTATTGTPMAYKLGAVGTSESFDGGSSSASASDLTLLVQKADEDGAYLTCTGGYRVSATDADAAEYTITFSNPGTYRLIARDPDWGTSDASKAPAVATVTVTGESVTFPAQLTALTVSSGYSNTDVKTQLLTGTNSNGVQVFAPGTTSYTLTPSASMTESTTQLRFRYTTEKKGTVVTLKWTDAEGTAQSKELSGASDGTELSNKWANLLKPGKNVFTLEVTPPEDSDAATGIYTFTLSLAPKLSALSLSADNMPVYTTEDFTSATTTYTVNVPSSASTLHIDATPVSAATALTYDGASSADVSISGKDSVSVTLSVNDATTTYTLNLERTNTIDSTVTVTSPAKAVVHLYDTKGATLASGISTATAAGNMGGTYHVSAPGYVAQTGSLTDGTTSLTLVKAADPETALPNYTGDWVNFRNSDTNMGITTAATPTDSSEAVLKWAEKYGTGWSAAPTPPIIVNDDLYIQMNTYVLRIDKSTGKELARGQLKSGSTYVMNPIVYGDGMLFVLAGDYVQALRADTLEVLWTSEKLSGQLVSPITYHNGYVYTGSWNGESADGYYYCFDVTDEDLTSSTETKLATWKLTHMGGFYWAGAYATDKYVVFGSDDGTAEGDSSANAVLYSVDPQTGAVIDTISGIKGDIRSTISAVKNADGSAICYCTTKGGLLIRVKIGADGKFDDTTYKTTNLGGMSTGTPLVYNGSLFIGVCGPAQFGTEGHAFKVLNADTLDLIASVSTPGYVQTSSLLSTAYVAENGKVYVYYTFNMTPGGIYVMEYDPVAKTETSSVLFTPDKAQQQYCICSLVCDRDGTLYYKNDSCYLMAVERNAAYATDITAQYGSGSAATLTGFDKATLSYELVVPANTKTVTIAATAPTGAAVKVNGTENSTAITLAQDGTGTANVVVTSGSDTRTYTVSIRWASSNANLSALKVNTSNAYSSFATISPTFDQDSTRYSAQNLDGSLSFANVWPDVDDANATVKVYAVSGVQDGKFDAATKEIGITATLNSHSRYAIYYADNANTAARIRVVVTAEDGTTTKTYEVALHNGAPKTQKATVSLMDQGAVAVNAASVTVKDRNGDGKFDVDEAIYALHEEKYANGGAAGYATAENQYGRYITKLWGNTSGNFGYYIGKTMCMSLDDTLAAGAHLTVYITAGTYPNNEPYSIFKTQDVTAATNASTALTLDYVSGYDETTYAPIFTGYAGATLTAYTDQDLTATTDKVSVTAASSGVYNVKATQAGTYWIVAKAANNGIVPAVCKLSIADDPDATAVIAKIDAIGTVTLNSASAITEARAAYAQLAADKQALVINLAVLEAAETTYAQLKADADQAAANQAAADAVIAKIAAIGEVTTDSKDAIEEARAAYNALTSAQAALVTNRDVLEAAESTYAALTRPSSGVVGKPGTGKPSTKPAEKEDEPQNEPQTDEETGSTTSGSTFQDVPGGTWYTEAVSNVVENGLMTGTGKNQFSPDASVTRGMMTTILARLSGVNTSGTVWYEAGRVWSMENGISDGKNMTGKITREQLATMLYRYAQYMGWDVSTNGSLSGYPDASQVGSYAVEALRWATQVGLINGRGGKLAPQGTATRAELAVILDRFTKNFKK